MPFLLALLATLLLGAPAHAQDAGLRRCLDEARTQMEHNACAAAEHRAADAELNEVYRGLVARTHADRRPALRAAQRAWIAFRDAHCRDVAADSEGGSIHPQRVSSCLAETTRDRTAQLRRRLAEADAR